MKHSSTSNSDFSSEWVESTREVAVQTMFVGGALLSAIVVAYQMLVMTTGTGGLMINQRPVSALEHLPALVSGDPGAKKVIVLGTSLVQFGFDPIIFDRRMARRGIRSVSYNFGFADQSIPLFQEVISRRIRDAFEADGTRLDLALVEFNPFQSTSTAKKVRRYVADQNMATLASGRELSEILLHDPTRGVRLLVIRHLRAGVSAEMYTTGITAWMNDYRRTTTQEFDGALQRIIELGYRFRAPAQADRGDRELMAWDPETRGGPLNKASLSAASLGRLKRLMAGMRDPELMQADLENRITGANILGLDFDAELIDAYVRSVENLRAISEHVEIVLFPRNTDWVDPAPEVNARLDAVIRSIADRTGVRVRNFQETPDIEPKHFSDTTHLSLLDGIVIFSSLLSHEYAELLR